MNLEEALIEPRETVGAGASDPPPMQVYVCTTCTDRRAGPGGRAGARLYADLAGKTHDPRVQVVPVACLNVCQPNCALSFLGEGKWTYVFAISAETDLATILEGADLCRCPEGIASVAAVPGCTEEGSRRARAADADIVEANARRLTDPLSAEATRHVVLLP